MITGDYELAFAFGLVLCLVGIVIMFSAAALWSHILERRKRGTGMKDITLTEEQSEHWRNRSYFQMILTAILFIFVLTVLIVDYEVGKDLMLLYIGGIIGVIVFVMTLPKIYYYSREEDESDG